MPQRIAAIVWFLSLGFLFTGCHLVTPPAKTGLPSPSQLLVVTTADWSSAKADLRRYERQGPDAPWVPTGETIPAMVGRNGLAWGRGLHPGRTEAGPQKREGDGKAPAGMFGLGFSFGYASSESVPWIRLPYRQMTEQNRCVDDVASPLYNRVVDEREVRKNWQSDEEMLRADGQYRLGVMINHNTAPVVPTGGSCIFLHIWKGPSAGTAGCTAVSAADMETLLGWLRPEANPVMVQLPGAEYERLRLPWDLPR